MILFQFLAAQNEMMVIFSGEAAGEETGRGVLVSNRTISQGR